MHRSRLLVVVTLCLLTCGCVEGDLLYTLNPDGSGKVQIDVVSAPALLSLEAKVDEPDVMARKLVARELSRTSGVTGWSDVQGEFLKDGRFRFRATAYFKNLEEIKLEQFDNIRLLRAADGAMTLKAEEKKKDDRPGKPKTEPPDVSKFTDADWERYILKQRIQCQMVKPFINSILADVKLKITFRMPGEVTNIKNARPLGKDGVAMELDGNAAIKEFNRRLALSDAETRKFLLSSKEHELAGDDEMEVLLGGTVSAMVKKPKGPLFDYEKEVAAAVAGNDELRKRYQIPAQNKLPGESKGKGSGPAPPPPPVEPSPAGIDAATIGAWRAHKAKPGWLGIFREWGFIEFGSDSTRLIAPMEGFQLSKESFATLPEGLRSLPRVAVPFGLVMGDVKVTDAMLKEVAGMKNVAGLAVFGPDVTDAGLKELQRMPDLTALYLQSTSVTDAGLGELKEVKKLTTLYIQDTRITDAGLKHVKELKGLSALYLYGTQVTDAGMAELKGLTHLTALNVRRTKVTGKGVAELKDLKELTALHLANVPITDEAMQVIAGFDKLSILDLMGARLSDNSVPALKGLKNLTFLNLQNSGISKEGIAEIEAALPKCRIER